MNKFVLTGLFAGMMLVSFAAADCFRPQIPVKKVQNFNLTDGINNPTWKNIPKYELMKLIWANSDIHCRVSETGFVKYLYDEQYLYILADFIDSDIIQNGKKDGDHLYLHGDLLEIFIKPANADYYWEIYGSPNGLTTRFFFAGKGVVGVPSSFEHIDTGMKVFCQLDGTLNNPDDRDKGYKMLLAIPISELNRPHATKNYPGKTVAFAPGEDWRLQSARYNYSCYLDTLELSSFPQTVGGYHNLKYFAEIKLLK